MLLERAEGPQGVKSHHTLTRKPALQLAPDPAENCCRHAPETTRHGLCLGAALTYRPETNDALHQVSRMATPTCPVSQPQMGSTPSLLCYKPQAVLGFSFFSAALTNFSGCTSARSLHSCRGCTTEKSTARGESEPKPCCRTLVGRDKVPVGLTSSSALRPTSEHKAANWFRRSLCRAYVPSLAHHKE